MSPGDVFGMLTVLHLIKDRKNPKAACLCECGNVVYPQRGALKNGRAKSCGCYRANLLKTVNKKHDMSGTLEYLTYQRLKRRCQNEKDKAYKNYGGRGIKCLFENFEEFFADVGKKPIGSWIDRIDNEKGYEPGNCRWVTPKENQENKRVSRWWTINGVTYVSSVAAGKSLGVAASSIVRGCNGYQRGGKSYEPRIGWSSDLKYK